MITVDRDLCIGSGNCAMTAPDVFEQDDADGRVIMLADQPGPESDEVVQRAVWLCPSGALKLVSA